MSNLNAPALKTPQQAQAPAVYSGPMPSAFANIQSFADAQRMATLLVSSDLVPDNYRGPDKLGNALIALEISQRIGVSPLMVMQNMHVIQGRPSWSSTAIIASVNSCGKFSPLRFRMEDRGEKSVPYTYWDGPKGNRQRKTGQEKILDRVCTAYAVEKATGETLEGPPVSMEMAVLEGWYTKNDSKWKTMPDLMLRYRAAAFFGRLYAPELLMGMPTAEEAEDIHDEPRQTRVINAPAMTEPATTKKAAPEVIEGEYTDADTPPAANDNAQAPAAGEPARRRRTHDIGEGVKTCGASRPVLERIKAAVAAKDPAAVKGVREWAAFAGYQDITYMSAAEAQDVLDAMDAAPEPQAQAQTPPQQQAAAQQQEEAPAHSSGPALSAPASGPQGNPVDPGFMQDPDEYAGDDDGEEVF